MKQCIEFTEGDTVGMGRVSLCFEGVAMSSVKLLLSSIIEKIDDMYADFIINGDGVCEYPDSVRMNIIDSLNRLRVEQKLTPQEQG